MIWLIGGTSESAVIAEKLLGYGCPCLVSVTTEAAIALYPKSELMTVKVGALSQAEMAELIRDYQIEMIVDASHPYAIVVSQSAIALANQFNLPYLRYERPALSSGKDPHTRILESFDTLINGDYLHQQRVLLTVGYKALPYFSPWQDNALLFARILPTIKALDNALAAGFTHQQLIALRPPVSYDLEKALCEQWNISLIVTKASGTAGGEDTKQAVAQALNIPLIVIDRPHLAYPKKTSTLEDVVNFCLDHG